MFEFEDFGEVIKLLASWLILSAAMPLWWWLVRGEYILMQMLRTQDGLVYFAMCFLVSVMFRPVVNRLVRRGSGFA